MDNNVKETSFIRAMDSYQRFWTEKEVKEQGASKKTFWVWKKE
jgi:hypothetical protein